MSDEGQIPDDIFQTACGIVMEAKSLKSMLKHKDVVDAIAKAVLAERERDQWQPIATAPKDGTPILISFGEKGVRAVSWDSPWEAEVTEENGIWCVDDDKHGPYPLRGYTDDGYNSPTHWMPLPAAPKGGA